jgi:hypothetical protein
MNISRKRAISRMAICLLSSLLVECVLAVPRSAVAQQPQKDAPRQAAPSAAPAEGRITEDVQPVVFQGKLVALEKGFFEAWKTGHPEYFDQHIAPGGIFFGQFGVSDKSDEVASQRQSAGHCNVISYELSNFRLVLASNGMAILTYRAEQHGTCYGSPFDPFMNGLSVYVQRDGQWFNAVRSEVPAKNWP